MLTPRSINFLRNIAPPLTMLSGWLGADVGPSGGHRLRRAFGRTSLALGLREDIACVGPLVAHSSRRDAVGDWPGRWLDAARDDLPRRRQLALGRGATAPPVGHWRQAASRTLTLSLRPEDKLGPAGKTVSLVQLWVGPRNLCAPKTLETKTPDGLENASGVDNQNLLSQSEQSHKHYL
jgi:hypothetical protein